MYIIKLTHGAGHKNAYADVSEEAPYAQIEGDEALNYCIEGGYFEEVDQADPSVKMDVKVDDPSTERYGLQVSALQEDVKLIGLDFSGTSHWVDSYPGFSNIEDEQKGNYLATLIEAPEDATVKITMNGGKTKDLELKPNDRFLVLRISNKDTQSLTVKVTKDDKSNERTFTFKGLNCEAKSMPVMAARAASPIFAAPSDVKARNERQAFVSDVLNGAAPAYGDGDAEALESMTLAELKAYAETTGVDLKGATKKADVIARIAEAEAK